MRLLPRSPWLGLLLSWTAVMWVAIVLLLASASISHRPCNPMGAGNPDPALPDCGIDDFSLVLTPTGWKIAAATYTVERTGCPESPLGPLAP